MNKTNKFWLCPECGMTGVSSYVPLCHRCKFKVQMVEISNMVYSRIGTMFIKG